jgi:hypothetical protein
MDLFRNKAASDWAAHVTWRSIVDDSGSIELEGETDFTPAERLAFRKMHREYSHASWLVRKVLPLFVVVVAGLTAAYTWVSAHIKA